MTIGIIGAIITGLSAPANTLIFGDLTNALVGKGRNDYVNQTNETYYESPIEPIPDDDFIGMYIPFKIFKAKKTEYGLNTDFYFFLFCRFSKWIRYV